MAESVADVRGLLRQMLSDPIPSLYSRKGKMRNGKGEVIVTCVLLLPCHINPFSTMMHFHIYSSYCLIILYFRNLCGAYHHHHHHHQYCGQGELFHLELTFTICQNLIIPCHFILSLMRSRNLVIV